MSTVYRRLFYNAARCNTTSGHRLITAPASDESDWNVPCSVCSSFSCSTDPTCSSLLDLQCSSGSHVCSRGPEWISSLHPSFFLHHVCLFSVFQLFPFVLLLVWLQTWGLMSATFRSSHLIFVIIFIILKSLWLFFPWDSVETLSNLTSFPISPLFPHVCVCGDFCWETILRNVSSTTTLQLRCYTFTFKSVHTDIAHRRRLKSSEWVLFWWQRDPWDDYTTSAV